MNKTQTYFTSGEAASYLRYKTVRGFTHAVRRHQIPFILRDHTRLFLKTDLLDVWAQRTARGWMLPRRQQQGAA